MDERTTIRLPNELMKLVRRKAASEGRTLTSVIEEGVRWAVGSGPRKKTKRVLPPISTATGGPAPGFEHITLSKIQELDDLEYMERMRKGFR
jgi:hypothetical protein